MVLSYTTDAVEKAGVFLSRELEQRLPKVYEKKYPGLKFANGELLPINASLEAGAESIIEDVMSTVGEAAEGASDQIDDIPLADAAFDQYKFPVICKPVAIRYSIRELDAARLSGRNVRGAKEMAARRSLEEASNILGAFGNTQRGLYGLLNDPNVPVESSITDNIYDAAYTADDLINLFNTKVADVVVSSNMAEEVDTALVPVRLHERMVGLRVGDSGMTVKQFLLENSTWLKSIMPVNELASATLEKYGVHSSGTNKDAIFFYSRNPDSVERLVQPITTMTPQLRGMHYIVYMYFCTTGAVWHYPGGALRVDIPKFA